MKCIAFLTGLAALAGSVLAASGNGNIAGSGLVVLHPTAQGALRQSGNSTIRVPAYAIYVNSSHNQAVLTQGTVTLDTPELRVCGDVALSPTSTVTGTIIRGGSPYTDPFANMSFPTGANMTNYGSVSITGGSSQIVDLNPGYYTGISITGNRMVNFRSGTYVIAGTGLRVTAGNIFTNGAQGVTLIISQGALDVAGASGFRLHPPMTGPHAYVVIAQPPSNTTPARLSGTSSMEIQGAIYTPGALLRLEGTTVSTVEGPQMGDLVVASQVELMGNSVLKIGRENLQAVVLPRMPLFD